MSQLLEGRKFDRVYIPDVRSVNFQVTATVDATTPVTKHWYSPLVLDQGNYPHCVAYAGAGWLSDGPICHKIDFSIPALYTDCQADDQWAGNNYDGTSVLGLMRVLKKRGLVSEYRWAFNLNQVRAHVLTTGPLVVGTNWTEGMSAPDKDNFVHLTGRSQGGHSWRIIGASDTKMCPNGKRGAFRAKNNWGREYGDQGRFWISYDDFANLLASDGEAATAIETPLARATAVLKVA